MVNDHERLSTSPLLPFDKLRAFDYRSKQYNGSRMAERQGFEPWIPFGILAFQASALGHYATSPK